MMREAMGKAIDYDIKRSYEVWIRRNQMKKMFMMIFIITVVSLPLTVFAVDSARLLLKNACLSQGGNYVACEVYSINMTDDATRQRVEKTCIDLCPQVGPLNLQKCINTCKDLSK